MLRTTDPKATDPQPGMGSLEGLVAQMNAAGVTTKLTVVGDPQTLPLGIDLNAYRIIQESLTNTLKHGGPGVTAEIRVAYEPGLLMLDISDDGRGASTWSDAIDGHRQGLVGMHERVTLLDGNLETGPRPGGGYRVAAQIPTSIS
jgi:signal transduction histidine kinase